MFIASFHVNINTNELVGFTNKLEKLHRYALPNVIRGTLNDVAFEMKKVTLLKSAKDSFIERQPNFFKANSKVEMAKGWDIKSMQSEVGMVSSGLHSPATNYAVKDLVQQESGGTIAGRSFKPLSRARRGGTGNVRANSRISQILKAVNLKAVNLIDAKDSKTTGSGKSGKMQQFIRASLHAGVGSYVLGGKILWRVKNIRRVGRNIKFTKENLYSFTKSGTARVKATGFMREAAIAVQKEMEMYYRIRAEKEFSKMLR